MNRLDGQIKGLIDDLTVQDDGNVSASVLFNNDFYGFSGHFPGKPVLPGICIIRTAMVICGIEDFSVIKTAKFFAPVVPGQKLEFCIRKTGYDMKCNVTCGQEKTAKLEILL